MKSKGICLQSAALLVLLLSAVGTRAYAEEGAAYTMTNAGDDNQIVAFSRDDDGLLTMIDTVSTGGKGSGGGVDPLASQGSLILAGSHGGKNHDNELLLAVNAGSNDVSVFQVKNNGIELRDRTGSGGRNVDLSLFRVDLDPIRSRSGREVLGVAG